MADSTDATHPQPDAEAATDTVADPGAADSPAAGGDADVKAQMRAALQRKQQHHSEALGGARASGSKVNEAHNRAGAKRQFRRKSGG